MAGWANSRPPRSLLLLGCTGNNRSEISRINPVTALQWHNQLHKGKGNIAVEELLTSQIIQISNLLELDRVTGHYLHIEA